MYLLQWERVKSESLLDKSPTINDNQKSNNHRESHTNTQSIIVWCLTIQSLTSKMRFFELFLKNKNLIKQGLYLLEIYQNAAGSTDLATDRHGHDGLSWTSSSHFFCCSLYYPRWKVWQTIIGTTVRRGPSFQNTSTLEIWVLGSLLWTSWRTCRTDRHRHDGPSQSS